MIPSQMLKGTLEGCILTVIGQGEVYGYEISQKLERYGFGKIAEGTIYPLLLRLEKNGCVSSFYRKSEVGPRRKYYTLTERGCNERDAFFQNYERLTAAVSRLRKEIGAEILRMPDSLMTVCEVEEESAVFFRQKDVKERKSEGGASDE